jgi:hypothetical protein
VEGKKIKVVTPVKTGVQVFCKSMNKLDSGPFDKLRVPSLSRDFRRNDGKAQFATFCEGINIRWLSLGRYYMLII